MLGEMMGQGVDGGEGEGRRLEHGWSSAEENSYFSPSLPAVSLLQRWMDALGGLIFFYFSFFKSVSFFKGNIKFLGSWQDLEGRGQASIGVPFPSSASSSQVVCTASQRCIKMQICPCLLGADSKTLNRKKAVENKQRAAQEGSWNRGFFLIIFFLFLFPSVRFGCLVGGLFNGI